MADEKQSQEAYPSALAFYFSVTILGGGRSGIDAAFQDVSGLSAEMGTDTYMEGGGNSFSYRLPTGLKYSNLVLSRGLAAASSPLIQWCIHTLESGLAYAVQTKTLQVSLLGPEEKILHSWSFAGAYPVKWQAEEFNSTTNKVAIEKIEFAFNSLTRNRSST